jgi:hypothetical protein
MAETRRLRLTEDAVPLPEWPQPPKAQYPKIPGRTDRRSDFVVAALGITLGLICAVFPWYIFYSQVRMATHGLHLGGSGTRQGRVVSDQAGNGPARVSPDEVHTADIDMFPTASAGTAPEDQDKAPGPDKQPFPGDGGKFRLLHVANGRAMIADDTGVWLVQRGSTLPDSSSVAAIEQRAGKWVLVTSRNEVIGLSN